MAGGQTILVIDDDDTAREVTSALLMAAGFACHAIASPIGATRAMRELRIEAVVCDLHMPAMQGDALAKLFRQSKSLHAIPVVVISSAPREELEPLLASGNVDAIVHKGDLHTGLVQQLRRLLTGRQPPGPLGSKLPT